MSNSQIQFGTKYRIGFRIAAMVITLLIGATALIRIHGFLTPKPVSASSTPGNITVGPNGVHLQRDGVVWAPHGVVMVAFECAPAAFSQQAQYLKLANEQYYADTNPDEFVQIKNWGADTVRIMISQAGTDPLNTTLYSEAYVTHIQNAVVAARSAGLTVILNLQHEKPSGETDPGMPDEATTRSWQKLAPLFNGDLGVMFEIFNEPAREANSGNWIIWQEDMNAIIAAIRDIPNTNNVIVVDGLSLGNSFAGDFDGGAPSYPLTDPANETAYAVHPYFHSYATQDAAYWDKTFGNLQNQAPLVVTEWYPGKVFFCADTATSPNVTTAEASLNLLQYISSKGFGITAFAYDFPGDSTLDITGSIAQDYAATMPTTFLNTTCNEKAYGPGTLLQNWYRTGKVPSNLE